MPTTTKKDLIDRIAENIGAKETLTPDILRHFLDEIPPEFATHARIESAGSGLSELNTPRARKAQNRSAMQTSRRPPKRTVNFKPGRRKMPKHTLENLFGPT